MTCRLILIALPFLPGDGPQNLSKWPRKTLELQQRLPERSWTSSSKIVINLAKLDKLDHLDKLDRLDKQLDKLDIVVDLLTVRAGKKKEES